MPEKVSWRRDAGTDAPASIPVAPWWESFGSPELNSLVARSFAKSPKLGAIAAHVSAARAQFHLANAPLLPALNAGGQVVAGKRFRQYTPGEPGDPVGRASYSVSRPFQAQLEAAFELDLWSRLSRIREAAGEELEATEEDMQTARGTLAAEAVLTVISAAAAREQLELLHRMQELRESELLILKTKRSHGVASLKESNDSENERLQLERRESELLRTIDEAEDRLALLLGEVPGETRMSAGLVQRSLALPGLRPDLPAAVLLRRPDIHAANARLRAAALKVGIAEANFLPQISLTGDAGLLSKTFPQMIQGRSFFWTATPLVSLPIFDHGKNTAILEGAQAELAAEQEQFRETVLGVFAEVESALRERAFAEAEEARAARRLSRAVEEQTRTDRAATLGAMSRPACLAAELRRLEAEDAVLQARTASLTAAVHLFRALAAPIDPIQTDSHTSLR